MIKNNPPIKELCEEFAHKYQLDIISIGENSANFKEYDGDGFIKRKYTFEEIKKRNKNI
jgi:hypothetical protein